jgi:peptidyl-prolyl cis-trans isomerase A (cyclophilin A)
MISLYRTATVTVVVLLVSASLFAQQSGSLPEAPQSQLAVGQRDAGQHSAGQTLPGMPGATSLDQAAPAQPEPQPTGPTVLFNTSMGRIVCRLYSKKAPVTVANFVGLATGTKDWTNPKTHQLMHGVPLYNGTIFHRVIPGFMIQGGDPVGTGMGGPGFEFKNEVSPDLNFDIAGRLAMANSGPDTNGSQFFITEAPADYLDQKYTIFGQCDDASIWVVKAIARVNRDEQNRPIDPVVLDSVQIVPAGQPVPPYKPPVAASVPSASPDAKPQP